MDWNSLVNTATKAINTDEDETTIMDLESEPAQRTKMRLVYLIIFKVQLTLLYSLSLFMISFLVQKKQYQLKKG